jgi:hypothetical protein
MTTKSTEPIILALSKNDFDIADACARELWRGYNYTDDYLTISDEVFMSWFGSPFIKLQKIHASSLHIQADQVDQFISVIKMRDNRINKTLDIENGLITLKNICQKDYANWKKITKKQNGGLKLATNSVKILGESLFRQNARLRQGRFFLLASRILFFAAPDLPIFNISEKVSDAFGIKSVTTEKSLIKFNSNMHANLQHYWQDLLGYKMPFSVNFFDDEHWMIAKDGGWWQRRVLDLAIMKKTGKIEVKSFINKAANQSISFPT